MREIHPRTIVFVRGGRVARNRRIVSILAARAAHCPTKRFALIPIRALAQLGDEIAPPNSQVRVYHIDVRHESLADALRSLLRFDLDGVGIDLVNSQPTVAFAGDLVAASRLGAIVGVDNVPRARAIARRAGVPIGRNAGSRPRALLMDAVTARLTSL